MPIQKISTYQKLALLVFILAAVLRIGIAALNREANDSHIKVIKIILNEQRLPTEEDDWEGFQPKLYHVTVAAVYRLLPFGSQWEGLTLTGQAVSCLAGLAGLWLTYLFLQQLPVQDKTRFWCFALTAFNPKLIGIQAQATNDSWVILFGALGIYATARYLRTCAWRDWFWLTAAICLAGLSKGNGLLLLFTLPAICVLAAFWRIGSRRTAAGSELKRLGLALTVLGLAFVLLVPGPGQYLQKFQRYGTPFATNISAQPWPDWSERSYFMRPGVISLRDAFFTFPLRSLLEYPMITTQAAWRSDKILFPGSELVDPADPDAYPFHRVSLWAQLYGRTHFVHFDQWPPSWQSDGVIILGLGRLLLLAGLLPGAVWLAGLFLLLASLLRPPAKWQAPQLQTALHLVCAVAYLVFLAFYALRIRDFGAMKAIFFFPAWLSFLYIFANGLERLWGSASRRIFQIALHGGLGAVTLLYGLDVLYLAVQLFKLRSGE